MKDDRPLLPPFHAADFNLAGHVPDPIAGVLADLPVGVVVDGAQVDSVDDLVACLSHLQRLKRRYSDVGFEMLRSL